MTIMQFADVAETATVLPGKRLRSEASYFSGSDPKQWRSHVPDYDSVTLHEVYTGLNVRFYEQGTQLEFDIDAQPGADLNRLRLRVDGDSVRVLADGALMLGEGKSIIKIKIPAAYQTDRSAHRLPVSASFTAIGDHEVRLTTGHLNSTLATVVDPTVAFSTLIESGPGEQGVNDMNIENVAVDSSGNVWIAGTTYGPLSDASSNPVLNCQGCDPGEWIAVAFAAKFDPSGNLLVTVALGETSDNTVGMVLDANGYVYLDGDVESGINFPVTTGAYQTTNSNNDIFVAKIDSTGSTLVWSSYLGGSQGPTYLNPERAAPTGASGSIQVDSNGDVFVVGASAASDFPVTAKAFQSSYSGTASGILAELSPDGSSLLYGTFLSGSSGSDISQIALSSGKVIVTGSTESLDFPVSPTAIHRTNEECGGTSDYTGYDSNFLTEVDPSKSGSAGLVFSTFICEYVQSMALDSSGNIYLGVIADSSTNNTAPTAGSFTPLLPPTFSAGNPPFTPPFPYTGIAIEEISADGSQVLKMSYLNVEPQAELHAIAVDSANNVYVSGKIWVDSTGSPIVDSVQPYLGPGTECNNASWVGQDTGATAPCSGEFLMKLDPQLDAPVFSTLYGPLGGSQLYHPAEGGAVVQGLLAVDSSGNIFGAGSTNMLGWPTTSGAFETTYGTGQEGFLFKVTGVPANPGVLLTADHLFFASPITCLDGDCSTTNNFTAVAAQTVTIVNHSGSVVHIFSIAGDGTSSDPLSASQNCLGALAVDATCSVTVSFTVLQEGDLTGTITITDDSATSPHVITGIAAGYMGVGSPASNSLTFPSTAVGQSSAAQTLLFNNTGNLTLNVSSVAATGDFSETDNCSGGINVGTACAVHVTFTPTQGGTRTGTLSIADDGPGSPHTINLTGIGASTAPIATFSPASLTFGSANVGTTSAAQTAILTNSGQSPLSITSTAATGDFTESNNCGETVAAGGSCTFSVTFSPSAAGTRTGMLTVTDNATGSPQTVPLTGTGVATGPSATLSPTSLTFGSTNVGTASAAQSVTMTNSGTVALTISSISASGDFAQTHTCGTSVAVGGSCTISVTFTPSAAGPRTSTLTITDNAAGSPQTAALAGTGVATAPAATLSPTSLTFSSQTDGTTSAAQTVTLTNSGTAALTVSSIAASGDFAQANTCGTSVAVGGSCTISVTFTPSAAGTRTGTLTVTDNATGSPQAIPLTGSGVATAPAATLSPTSLTFASANVGVTSAAQTVTLTNSGTAALSLLSIAASGDFAVSQSCGSSIAVGGDCTLSVTFTPTAAGSRTGTVSVTDNATSSPQTVSLTGTGVEAVVTGPAVTLSPTSLTFAAETVGSTSPAQKVTLTNSGTTALSLTSIAASGDFAVSQSCGTSLAAGGSCALLVSFAPTGTGTLTGTLSITDNAGGSPQTVSLSGGGEYVALASTSSGLSITSAGGDATGTIQIAPVDGFAGTVNLTCTVAYQGQGTATDPPTCALNPAQAQVSGTTPISSTLTVSTTAASASAAHEELWKGAGISLAALFCCGFLPRRRWHRGLLLIAVCITATAGLIGCGSSPSSSNPSPSNPGTTAGSYVVTVTATSGAAVASTTISLSLQ